MVSPVAQSWYGHEDIELGTHSPSLQLQEDGQEISAFLCVSFPPVSHQLSLFLSILAIFCFLNCWGQGDLHLFSLDLLCFCEP